jgi:hypothetical protein
MLIVLENGGSLEIIPNEMVCISKPGQNHGDIDQCLLWDKLPPETQRVFLRFAQKVSQEASEMLRHHNITY